MGHQPFCMVFAEPVKAQDDAEVQDSKKTKKRFASSWDAKAAGAEKGTNADYLSNLGQAQEYNINVTHGAALISAPKTAKAHIKLSLVGQNTHGRLLISVCCRPE